MHLTLQKREKVFTKLVFIAQIKRCYGAHLRKQWFLWSYLEKAFDQSERNQQRRLLFGFFVGRALRSRTKCYPISAGGETIFYRVWIPFPLVNAPVKKYGAMHFVDYWGSTIWDIFQKQQMCYIMCKDFWL
ncbi:hypothetical protein CDAR_114031 [Caerostris darwini]|uniref:Maturase K n=1 Tax=Caerostris darwini TaxID=1538125 RepID=A0AAV4RZ38_9ARAC|nr:hypothetical protein CDAR_114031 [Caerostris darwini]